MTSNNQTPEYIDQIIRLRDNANKSFTNAGEKISSSLQTLCITLHGKLVKYFGGDNQDV